MEKNEKEGKALQQMPVRGQKNPGKRKKKSCSWEKHLTLGNKVLIDTKENWVRRTIGKARK